MVALIVRPEFLQLLYLRTSFLSPLPLLLDLMMAADMTNIVRPLSKLILELQVPFHNKVIASRDDILWIFQLRAAGKMISILALVPHIQIRELILSNIGRDPTALKRYIIRSGNTSLFLFLYKVLESSLLIPPAYPQRYIIFVSF